MRLDRACAQWRRTGARPCLALLLLLLPLVITPAAAALSQAQLDAVAAAPAAPAAVPLDLQLLDQHGRLQSVRALVQNRPSLLVLADYRCTQLCGSILGIAANALKASGLRPREDFNLLVVGFNPEATTGDAEAMRRDQLGAYPELAAMAPLLAGSPEAIGRLERALGFTAVRDTVAGRYAHPVDLYVLAADGRVSRLLNGLSLDPDTLRLALVGAGHGRIGSLVDRLHVLCYGLDPLSGASTALAHTMLSAGGTLTLIAAGALVSFAVRRRAALQAGRKT